MSFGKTVTLNTGAQIPRIGYGTWQAKPGEVGNGVYEALKAGYRHLDLAKVYGNQREVGEGIRRAIADVPGLKREDIFITSKLWNTSHRPEHVAAALDDTLAELGLEYLDLYLIHWAVAFTPDASGPLANLFPKDPADPEQSHLDKGVSITQTWKAMTELSKEKARAVGVSNFTIEQLEAVSKATGVVPAANQIERHPRLPGTELVDYCKSKNIIITAYSGFGNNTVGAPLLVTNPDVVAIAERLSAAQGKTVTPAQVLLAWGVVGGHTIIPKSVTAARIVENFQEVELDDEALATLKKLGEEPYRFNIPFTYTPKWNVDCFGDVREKDAATKTVISL